MSIHTEINQKLLDLRKKSTSSDFSGFGVIIYNGEVENLPLSPLVKNGTLDDPIFGASEILDFLMSISSYLDARHDGFHLIHEKLGLTHLAHFFSPPIPQNFTPRKFNIGARYRSAEIGSMISSVSAIIIFGKNRSIFEFKDGVETANETK